jgi:hypothetical protein
MAAPREKLFRMSFLKISAPDFGARNLRRNRQNGHAATLAIVQAIDQMQVSGPAASGAHSQFASEMRLCACRERGGLLIACSNPLDLLASANRVRDAIERVAWDSINSLNVRFQ